MERLKRSRQERMVAGVCGGLGEYWKVDPTLIRLAWALLAMVTLALPCLVLYAVAWAVVPPEDSAGPEA